MLAAGYPSNLILLCVLRAGTSLSDLFLIAPRSQRSQREIASYFSELGALCAFARVIFYPIFSSTFGQYLFTTKITKNLQSNYIGLCVSKYVVDIT